MNALKELLRIVNATEIKCAEISCNDKSIELKAGHTFSELTVFLESLDFEYDDGYGGQELYGLVWLDDGTWLSRGEYDGSEWWERHVLPEIPEHLLAS